MGVFLIKTPEKGDAMQEEPKNEVQEETKAEKKKMGPIAWIKNYGYYYKGWFLVGIIGVVILLAIVFMLRYDGADLRLSVVTQDPIEDETYYSFLEKVDAYVYDVDGDNTKIPRFYRYTLTESKTSLALSELEEKIGSNDYLGFIVDEAGYAYIKTICELRELSFFGIKPDADDPFRLTITGTALTEDTGLDGTKYYLVMKYIENTEYNDLYVSGRTDILVGMGLNNDSDPDNNVTIQRQTNSGFSLFGR